MLLLTRPYREWAQRVKPTDSLILKEAEQEES